MSGLIRARPSRRIVLRTAAAAGGGALALLAAVRGGAKWLVSPALDGAAPGRLASSQVRTLVAATAALAERPIREEHYAGFFRWRAEHLPGHRRLYARFCTTVDRAARQTEGRPFAACEKAWRRAILEPAFRARARALGAHSWLDRLLDREWLLYDRHIVSEALALFAATDAWLHLGYDAWPGTARGFERYRRPPT